MSLLHIFTSIRRRHRQFIRQLWGIMNILDESAVFYLANVVRVVSCKILIVQHGGAALAFACFVAFYPRCLLRLTCFKIFIQNTH